MKDDEEKKEKAEKEEKERVMKEKDFEINQKYWNNQMDKDNVIPDIPRFDQELKKKIKVITDSKEITEGQRSSRIISWDSDETDYGVRKMTLEIRLKRENGVKESVDSMIELLRICDRSDLMDLYQLSSERVRRNDDAVIVKLFMDMMQSLFKPASIYNVFFYCQERVMTWRYFARAGVHMVVFNNGQVLYMFDDRHYVLGTGLLNRLASMRMSTKIITEGAYRILYLVFNQLHKRQRLEEIEEEKRQKMRDEQRN